MRKRMASRRGGILIGVTTISNYLRKTGWTKKSLKLVSRAHSKALRKAYLYEIQSYSADDLIFLDESIFNEKTGWRPRARAPIGDEARYSADINRGAT
jgi:hypothetical protein